MRLIDKLKKDHPEKFENEIDPVEIGYPDFYGYTFDNDECPEKPGGIQMSCEECWNREVQDE